MENKLSVEIVTPERRIFQGESSLVVVPAMGGEIGIMPQHSPFVSILKSGEARVRVLDELSSKEVTLHIAVAGGYVEFKDNRVLLLADHARVIEEIDVEKTKADLEKLQMRLSSLDPEDLQRELISDEIRWCELQLHFKS